MSKIRKFTMLFSLGLLVVLFLTACDTKTIKHIDYKVYFEGANLTPVEVMQGKLLDKPVDPTKEGFKFVGWYSDSEFGTRFDFDITPIENNMTLYAKWEPLPYVKTDEDLVLEAKNDLSLGNVHNVTSNMVLPLQGINGTNITWSSNNKDHLKDDGTIIRPEYQLGNVVVDLTATITLNDAVTTKTFSVTILKTIQERFTVSEVQNLTAQQLVTVEGFVSALSNRRMVIQDENGVGIYIWLSGVKGDLFGEQEIGLGDKVKVFGEFKPGAVNQIDINNTTSGYYVLKLEESQDVVYQTLDYTDMAAFLENDFNDVAGKTYEFKGVKIIQNTLSSSTRRIVFVDQSGLQVAIRVDGNILPDVETGLKAKNIQVGDVYNITTTFYGIDSSTIWSGILSKAEHIEENDEAYLYHALTKLDVFAKTEATADLDFVNQVVIGTKTVNVTYGSSNEAVIANNGVVTRAVGSDKDVTISVTLTLGSLTIDKEVEITVLADISYAEKAQEVKESIKLFSEYVVDFNLPISGLYKATIAWASSNTDVILVVGDLAKVQIQLTDETVTLTATISFVGSSETFEKTFEILVPAREITDEYLVDSALALIEFDNLSITSDLNVNFDNPFNVDFDIESSNEPFLSKTGKVTRHGYEDQKVDLTVTVSHGLVSKDKTFKFTILKIEGLTVKEFNDLPVGTIYEVKGIVAAKSTTRIVIQDLDGTGAYVWLNTPQMDAYASDVVLGDFIVAKGEKNIDGKSGLPQLNINNKTSGYTVTNYNKIPGLDLHAPIEIDSSDLSKLPENWNDLQGKTYLFTNFTLLKVDQNYVLYLIKNNANLEIILKNNMLPDVEAAYKSLGLVAGDIINLKGTFYSGDGNTTVFAMLLASGDDIEIVEPAGRFDLIKADITPEEEVAESLTLKFASLHNSTVAWSSNDVAVGVVEGVVTVTQPKYPAVAKEVVLTASVTIGDFTKEFSFNVTVLPKLTEEDKVLEAKKDLDFSIDLDKVALDFPLPATGLFDTVITWASGDDSIIEVSEASAVVKRSVIEDKIVTLTATIKLGDAVETKDFVVTVLQGEITDEDLVDSALALIDFDELSIKSDLNVNFDNPFNVDFDIESSNELFLSKTGKVTRHGYEDQEVDLTVTVSHGLVSKDKTFKFTILKIEGLTVKEFNDLAAGATLYEVKGIVAAKGPSRIVIQDLDGTGAYVWLNTAQMNAYAKDVVLGDFIVAKGVKAATNGSPQLNINALDKGYTVTNYGKITGLDLHAPIVIDSTNVDTLPTQFNDLLGKTYQFVEFVVILNDNNRLAFYEYATNKRISVRISSNILPDVKTAFDALNIAAGDVITVTGTFYGVDEYNKTPEYYGMILSSATDIVVVSRA